jgi:L-lactate dehydrogenase complex protein LldG
MADKNTFLKNIAQKLGRPMPEKVIHPHWEPLPLQTSSENDPSQDLVDRFIQEVEKLTGQVMRVNHLQDLPQAIIHWIKQNNIGRLIAWEHPFLAGQTLSQSLKQLSTVETTFWSTETNPKTLLEASEKAHAGFVVAQYGLAETGSIVLYNGRNQGRVVSLLPPICAVILFSSQILPRLTQVLPRIGQEVAEFSCINIITGPSRSADIEMDLSIGVHGPGRIVIFLVDDSPPRTGWPNFA